MEPNSKKLERLSKVVYYGIAWLLCLFLILLSNNIIEDLDQAATRPDVAQFEQTDSLRLLQQRMDVQQKAREALLMQKTTIEKTIETAQANYTTEKQSFDNWVQTRTTLGLPGQDQEVLSRAKKLDNFYQIEQSWRGQLDSLDRQIQGVEAGQQAIQTVMDRHREGAYQQYTEALKAYELKVFLIRLLFVAPVLALGIFFFARYRNHRFWPLYFGFGFFSLYAFFVGLVPYLPSYGGYIRYTAGVLLSLGAGYYAIRRISRYLEEKKAELQISTRERARKVQIETAEKALENHFCPSCGKDFILKKWEIPQETTKSMPSEAYRFVTNFCRHCGLELFKPCPSCGHKNFAHLPFCSSCGSSMTQPAKDPAAIG